MQLGTGSTARLEVEYNNPRTAALPIASKQQKTRFGKLFSMLFALILTAPAQASTSQTITFDAIPNQLLGISPFTIAAQASSLLPVSFASTTPTVCKAASVLVAILSTGTCSITASQGGNATYSAATPVTRSFTVTEAMPSYGFTQPADSPFAVGAQPVAVVVGDFNGDGFPDLATANTFPAPTVTVLLGNGSGGFTQAPGSPYSIVIPPSSGGPNSALNSIAVGDFNGDGFQDLATLSVGSYPGTDQNALVVTVLLGNGKGEFTSKQGGPISLGLGGVFNLSMVVGDFNGDGIQDLAWANSTAANSVTVLLGNGSGGFTQAAGSPFAVGGYSPLSIAVGDFNADGHQDLVTANADSVTVLLGDGSGGFKQATGSPFTIDTGPDTQLYQVLVGDFNGDGNQDVAAATTSGNGFFVVVLLGNGMGGFAEAPDSPSRAVAPRNLVVGDFNGDGKEDLAAANSQLLLGNGMGGFAVAGVPLAVGGPAPVTADFNGDGRPDLATLGAGNNVAVLLGAGLPAIVSVSPASGTGTSVTFTAVYSDPPGATDLSQVLLLVNDVLSDADACYVKYYPQGNLMYLLSTGGTLITPALTPGVAGMASNGLCTLNAGASSVGTAGNSLTLKVALSFSSAFAGSKNVFLYAAALNGYNSGWVMKGTWTPNPSAGPPAIVSLSPTSGTGASVTFQAVYSDPNGAGFVTEALLLVNSALTTANGCYVYYQPQLNHLYLANNAGNAWMTPALTPGVAGTASNSQCTLNAGTSFVSTAGNNLTLYVALSFSGTFIGSRNVYLYAAASGQNTGWAMRGTWTNPSAGPPAIVSLSPNSGAGTFVEFQAVYSDPNGAGDLSEALLQVNNGTSGANACYVYYQAQANHLYLANDAGSAWMTPALTPGVAGMASNSQCTLNAGFSSVSQVANDLTLRAALTFSGAFVGSRSVYLYAVGLSGQNSGWVEKGTWTPSPSAGPPAIVSLSPNSGAGASVTFQAVYSDPNGAGDLSEALLLVNTGISGADACYVNYNPRTNHLYLANDAGTGWVTPTLTPGVAGMASNSQCTLNAGSSSVAKAANNLTLNVALSFSGTFTGATNVYLYAAGISGQITGWVKEGAWTP